MGADTWVHSDGTWLLKGLSGPCTFAGVTWQEPGLLQVGKPMLQKEGEPQGRDNQSWSATCPQMSCYTALCSDPVLLWVLGPRVSRTWWTGAALLPVTLTPTPADSWTLWDRVRSPLAQGSGTCLVLQGAGGVRPSTLTEKVAEPWRQSGHSSQHLKCSAL